MTKIKTYIRIILLTLILTTLIIGGSFYYGTFNPNNSVIEKIQKDFHKKEVEEVIYLGLVQPEYDYNDKESFIKATGKCVDYLNFTTDRAKRVPTSMIIAMAGIESGWGTSRFATEGNALFGVRTWDPAVPQMKARGNLNADWGVKKYETKCDSVKDMIRILNTHPAYQEFRAERSIQMDQPGWDYQRLLAGITAWSTNPKYADIIWSTIVDNNLP